MTLSPKLIEKESQVPKECPLDDRYGASPEALQSADIIVETRGQDYY